MIKSLSEEFSKIYHCGYINGRYLYSYKEKNIGKGIHTIVAEVFLNHNNPIPNGYVVDHLNTNSLDNRVENLRICTHSENMKNNITREHCVGKKIIDNKGNIYYSIRSCAKMNSICSTTLSKWIKERPEKGFRYYQEP